VTLGHRHIPVRAVGSWLQEAIGHALTATMRLDRV
jgi:hypothetical protein